MTSVLQEAGRAAVSDGRLYASSYYGTYVFDVAGTTNCGGSPRVCQPLWSDGGSFSGTPAIA